MTSNLCLFAFLLLAFLGITYGKSSELPLTISDDSVLKNILPILEELLQIVLGLLIQLLEFIFNENFIDSIRGKIAPFTSGGNTMIEGQSLQTAFGLFIQLLDSIFGDGFDPIRDTMGTIFPFSSGGNIMNEGEPITDGIYAEEV